MRARGRSVAELGLIAALVLSCETRGDVLSSDASSGGAAGEPGAGGTAPVSPSYKGNPSDLSAGDAHSCFVDAGRLFCFGRGTEGQLGTGFARNESIAVRVGENSDYVMVRCGGRFTCALRSNGSVECSGEGESGSLGNGENEDRLTLSQVLLDQPIDRLSVGSAHACAITRAGALYCWGKNTEGQLGLDDPFPGDGVDRNRPVEVEPGRRFRDVSAGQGHTCVVDSEGILLCVGRNTQNQLGLGDEAADQIRILEEVDGDGWTRVSAGQDHSCAQRSTGALYCWGNGSSGQLGLGDLEDRDRPTLIRSDDVLDFDLDTFHTCVIGSDGALCTGRGIEGSLGTGTLDQDVLALAPATPESVAVAVGRFHTCVREPETVLCTGENGDGRLGVEDLERRSVFSTIVRPAP